MKNYQHKQTAFSHTAPSSQPRACAAFLLCLTIPPSTHISARMSPAVCVPLDFSSAEDAFHPASPTACTLFKAAEPKYNPGGFAPSAPPLQKSPTTILSTAVFELSV